MLIYFDLIQSGIEPFQQQMFCPLDRWSVNPWLFELLGFPGNQTKTKLADRVALKIKVLKFYAPNP